MVAETITIPSGLQNLDVFWALVDDASAAMLLMRGSSMINCNATATEMFGCDREELSRRFPWGLSPERQPTGELSSQLIGIRMARVEAGEPQVFSWQHYHADGSPFTVIAHLRRLPPALVGGATDYVMIEMYQASEEQELKQLHIDEEDYLDVFREMIESANDAMLLVENGLIVECNPAACALYGLSKDQLLLNNPVALPPEYQPDGSRSDHRAREQLEELNQRLEQRNREVEELLEQAHQDPLLQIPTLVRFIELLGERSLSKADKSLAIVDLDEFSAINGALGHEFGDCVLKVVCARLSDGLPGCVIARVGSDVFGVVGPSGIVNPKRLHSLFETTFEVAGELLRLSATVGLVRLENHSLFGSELLKDAHVALKLAKNSARGNSVYFSEPMGEEAKRRVELLSGLREALHGEQLFMVYQPKVWLDDASPSGLEALIRWRLGNGDMIPPDQFIPLAEQSGLIIPIGTFVLRTACAYLAQIRARGHTELVMAINVSQMQLREPDFLDVLAAALKESAVPADKVELEITESIAADDLKRITHSLNQIMELGVRIAIDDFGTGFSSLSVLTHLPANRLKIDRSFINDLLDDDRIARMIISLGQSLDLDITAEGVETEEQRQALIALRCGEAQGWHFGRPMEGPACLEWLGSRRQS